MENRIVALPVKNADKQSIVVQNQFEDCCSLYHQRLHSLALIKQLNQLIEAVQKHRGLSMALLAGDASFTDEFLALQHSLDRRIAMLGAFARHSGNLLSRIDRENIDAAWQTLKLDWQDDTVIDNFELHSHFIDQLLNLMTSLGRYLERPMYECLQDAVIRNTEQGGELSGSVNSFRVVMQLGLLAFVCKQMPDMIELIAKIRGLATHAMVVGECSQDFSDKLRYLIRCAKTQREKLGMGMGRMTDSIRDQLPSLPMIKTYDLKLMYMLDKVEHEVLASQRIATDQHSFFELGSDIIGVYVDVVSQGLDLLHHWHEEQLEEWLLGEVKGHS